VRVEFRLFQSEQMLRNSVSGGNSLSTNLGLLELVALDLLLAFFLAMGVRRVQRLVLLLAHCALLALSPRRIFLQGYNGLSELTPPSASPQPLLVPIPFVSFLFAAMVERGLADGGQV
jgi:hypothetical protein